jgi:uncharacterized protein YdhG (YjbR/CyaY superfamily)
MKTGIKFETVDEYISTFPASTKKILKEMRKTIKQAAPDADELISYNMPAFKQEGILVYYAGYKGHIGFYPVSSAIAAFKKDLSDYELSKGTVRFPLDKPIPLDLIAKIVKFRVQENLKKSELKKKKK